MTEQEAHGYREVAEVQFVHVALQLTEVKERVDKLETIVGRGRHEASPPSKHTPKRVWACHPEFILWRTLRQKR